MLNCRRMSSLFFYDPIALSVVCDIYRVSRNMGSLRGTQTFNTDGTLFDTAPLSGPISLSMFRGKCTTSSGNSVSANRQASDDEGRLIGRLTLIYSITAYNIANNLCSSISFNFSQFIEGSPIASNQKLTINGREYTLSESPFTYTYPNPVSIVTIYLIGTVAAAPTTSRNLNAQVTYEATGNALMFLSLVYNS